MEVREEHIELQKEALPFFSSGTKESLSEII